MEFLSFSFITLFTLCFIFYYILKDKYRNTLLLITSFVFIGWFHLTFLITAIVIALYTLFCAQWIEHLEKKNKSVKRAYLMSIAGLIIGWLTFHYASLTTDILQGLPFFTDIYTSKSLLIPIGLSFYTFQAISYLTDVYWQEQKAERNSIDFMLYMLFFMKFLSGPIERAEDLLTQLKNPRTFDYSSVVFGLKLILLGLFKKLLIANHLAPQTASMFSSIHEISGLQLLMTSLLYPIELYADFSGYTDIAIGGACMFGIKLSPNFNRPFVACNTSDLWRRWHMSLSFWVRDYLYVPLTAATRDWREWGVFFSLIITFLALGMWHGAGITFAIYGLIQGIIICCEMKFPYLHNNLHRAVGNRIANALLIIRTYLLFAFSLLFFRLSTISDVWYYLKNISFKSHYSWKELNIGLSDHSCIVVGSTLLLLFLYEHFSSKKNLMLVIEKQPIWLRWSIYYVLFFALITLGKFDNGTFIYLQF